MQEFNRADTTLLTRVPLQWEMGHAMAELNLPCMWSGAPGVDARACGKLCSSEDQGYLPSQFANSFYPALYLIPPSLCRGDNILPPFCIVAIRTQSQFANSSHFNMVYIPPPDSPLPPRNADTPTKLYKGGCHCRKFEFECRHPILEDGFEVISCNCSWCSQQGCLNMYVSSTTSHSSGRSVDFWCMTCVYYI